ncbi:DNA transposition protein [Vibrio cholerae 2740-80]|uniref:DNA transposition protein n=7 Tax=Vibrio TaxID=662 RepID=A0A0H3ALZ3_VIBC3|nr:MULTISPECIES: AAA family ATPase [Vibrio]ABQ19634.1 DNA transposition protein [Vibrio cholerae O395]ABQ21335.1 DNA transposition protein [Vibrio cholerae O395]ACP09158.1 DNA transposition protein [Vibrio cholerae O395]ACP09292.1 DNA transposition protein [Vibrio cholerae O395]AKB06877.1 DNA transposition protein [Vibrio cholerae]
MKNVVALQKAEVKNTTVVMDISALIEAKAVTGAQIAKEISVSPATLSQIMKGTYAADPSNVIDKLEKWLRMREQRQSTPNVNPGFVMTETAKQIMADLTYAQITESFAVIFGASGVGKTETAREYQRSNNNVWMITASPSRASLTECLYELAMELGLDQAPRRKGPLSRVIRQRLLNSEGLVIIDESDHLDYPTLEELRILQEETGIGMALLGNNKVYTQLTGGRRNEDFARLFSRIAKKRGIHKAKKSDVKAIAQAWNVMGEEEQALMQQVSERPGALRLLTKTLKLSVMYANGKAMDTTLLRKAFAELTANE